MKVRWSIFDENHEEVASKKEFLGSTIGFGMLTPLGHPDEAMNKPYSLVLEYEHEQHNSDMGEPECPKIELHFIVEPAHFHTESLECSAYELD